MKKILSLAVILGAMLPVGIAHAQQVQGAQRVRQYGAVILADSFDPSVEFFLSAEDMRGMNVLRLLTSHTSTTAGIVNMQCNETYDVGGTQIFSNIQTCVIDAGGACQSADAAWNKTVPIISNVAWTWRVDVSGMAGVQCVLTKVGGLPTDIVTVYATGSTY